MDAKKGLEMFSVVNPKTGIAIHYNDYDVIKSTLDEFQAEVRNVELEEKVYYLPHGETYNFQISSLKDHH